MFGTISGVTINLLSTLLFQYFLIVSTNFNYVADQYYLSLAFGLFVGSVYTSMIQFSYQQFIFTEGQTNSWVLRRIKRLIYFSSIANTFFVILSTFIAKIFFDKDFFSTSEVLIICVVGVMQIFASITVILHYGLGGKFLPGFSGIYPSIGSCVVVLSPTLTTILIGLIFGYLFQILQNLIYIRNILNHSPKRETIERNHKSQDEVLMTLQYLLLSFSNFFQRFLFSLTPTLSISIYATAEKIAQTGNSLLTAGFNQHVFNQKSLPRSPSSTVSTSRLKSEMPYLLTTFSVIGLILLAEREILTILFGFIGVTDGNINDIYFFLKPLTLSIAFFAVGSLITNKFYSLGQIRIAAKTGIFNALSISATLLALFLTEKMRHIAIALLVLSVINTTVKIFQWSTFNRTLRIDSRISPTDPELKYISLGLVLLSLLSLVSL